LDFSPFKRLGRPLPGVDSAAKGLRKYKGLFDSLSFEEKIIDVIELEHSNNFEEVPHVVGIDGGRQFRDHLSISLVLARAAAVSGKEGLVETRSALNILPVSSNVDNYAGLLMGHLELSIARHFIRQTPHVLNKEGKKQDFKHLKPDIILLDGSFESIFQQGLPKSFLYYLSTGEWSEKIRENSFAGKYLRLFKAYSITLSKLIEDAVKNDVLLLAVSKDSKARFLAENFNLNVDIPDTVIAMFLLNKTPSYLHPLIRTPKIDAHIANFWKKQGLFKCFPNDPTPIITMKSTFMKYSNYSEPFRLDYLSFQEDKFNELLPKLSLIMDTSGFPFFARWSHQFAHVTNDEIETIDTLFINHALKMQLSNEIIGKLLPLTRRRRIQ